MRVGTTEATDLGDMKSLGSHRPVIRVGALPRPGEREETLGDMGQLNGDLRKGRSWPQKEDHPLFLPSVSKL